MANKGRGQLFISKVLSKPSELKKITQCILAGETEAAETPSMFFFPQFGGFNVERQALMCIQNSSKKNCLGRPDLFLMTSTRDTVCPCRKKKGLKMKIEKTQLVQSQ